MERLGLLAQQRQHSRCRGPATGERLTVAIDAVRWFKALEADVEAPSGGFGTRAIGATTMLLAIGANDVKRGLQGIGFGKLVDAFFSKRFRDFASAHSGEMVAIGSALPGSNAAEELPMLSIKLRYWAVAALVFAAFTTVPHIARQLGKVYTLTERRKIMQERLSSGSDNYTVLRAACKASLRPVQLPTPAHLAAFISQVLLAFNQWAGWLGLANPRPSTAAAEVCGHSYVLRSNGVVALRYAVIVQRPSWREGAQTEPGTPEFLREQFGSEVLDAAELQPLFQPPLRAITEAFENNGVEPLTSVPRQLAVAVGTVLRAADVRALRDFSGCYSSPRLRKAGVALKEIVENTVAQVRTILSTSACLCLEARS